MSYLKWLDCINVYENLMLHLASSTVSIVVAYDMLSLSKIRYSDVIITQNRLVKCFKTAALLALQCPNACLYNDIFKMFYTV